MLEMAERIIWGSRTVLKSQIVFVQEAMCTSAVQYATRRPRTAYLKQERVVRRQYYKESSRAFTTELTRNV